MQTNYLLDLNTSLTQVLAEFGPGGTEDDSYYLMGLDIVGKQTGADWSYFNSDGLGTVRQVTDVSGELLSAQHYDPYGVPLQINGLPDIAGMGFTGEQTDSTGLVYLRARHYNPSLGVFMSKDPVMGVPGDSSITFNPYSYVRGNPINYTDPSGELAWFAIPMLAAGAAVIAGFSSNVQNNMNCYGMGFWDAVYHPNIDWGLISMSAGMAAVAGQQAAFAGAAVGGAFANPVSGQIAGSVAEITASSVWDAAMSETPFEQAMADNLKFTVLFSTARMVLKYGRGVVNDFRSSYQLKGNLGLKGAAGPHGFGIVRGKYSGRDFDPTKAGGPIRNLSYKNVKITSKGIDVVENHLKRFEIPGMPEAMTHERGMVGRLRAIAAGEIEATNWDRAFYTHELREYIRYKRLGWRTGMPVDEEAQSQLWNDTHTATLEDYQLHELMQPGQNRVRTLYHPNIWDGR